MTWFRFQRMTRAATDLSPATRGWKVTILGWQYGRYWYIPDDRERPIPQELEDMARERGWK